MELSKRYPVKIRGCYLLWKSDSVERNNGGVKAMKKVLASWFRTVSKFVRRHAPVMCVRCLSICFEKNMKYERHTLGRQVALCPKCHKELFTPFSGGDK